MQKRKHVCFHGFFLFQIKYFRFLINYYLSIYLAVVVPRWLEKFCDICIIQGCAEFWSLSLSGRHGSHSATVSCKGLKVKLDQLTDLRGIYIFR